MVHLLQLVHRMLCPRDYHELHPTFIRRADGEPLPISIYGNRPATADAVRLVLHNCLELDCIVYLWRRVRLSAVRSKQLWANLLHLDLRPKALTAIIVV
jgi:hypothetical protein